MELTSKNLSFNNLGSVLKVGVLPIGILAVVAMMVLPIPAFLLDLFFVTNILVSLLVLMVAMHTYRPLDFSSFPSLLLIATVLARPNRWRQLAFGCTMASVIGGVVGWVLGKFFSFYLYDWLSAMPAGLAVPSAFSAVEAGFSKFGIFLVFLGAFSPLPYKVIAVSAGLGGFNLLPFILTSIIGRGLRFTIVAAIAKNNGNPRIVIILITTLVCFFSGGLWLIR